MKRSKLVVGAATLVLAVASVLITKANKSRFSTQATVMTQGGAIRVVAVVGSFTTVPNTHQAFYKTNAGALKTLVTSAGSTKKAYYH